MVYLFHIQSNWAVFISVFVRSIAIGQMLFITVGEYQVLYVSLSKFQLCMWSVKEAYWYVKYDLLEKYHFILFCCSLKSIHALF